MHPPRADRRTHRARPRLRRVVGVLVLAAVLVGLIAVAVLGAESLSSSSPPLTPFQARLVRIADRQLGYRTDPADSYCNRYSAYFDAGEDDCGPGLRDEEWCADFAAWVWLKAGAEVTYGYQPGQLNGASISFYDWGIAHHTWHAVGSGYVPVPGDVAVYGLDVAAGSAQHVAVVVGLRAGMRGPDVVNGDGSRTGFSVVELGLDQYRADIAGPGGALSGYVSPSVSSRRARRS